MSITDEIVSRISKIKKAARRAARSERRFSDYCYLKRVLATHRYFEKNRWISHLSEIAPSVLLTPVRRGAHPLRILIDATCLKKDKRMRSRWTRALEYAVAQDIDPAELPRFLRAHGGVSGAADLAAKTTRPRKRHFQSQPRTPTGDNKTEKARSSTSAQEGPPVRLGGSPWLLL